MKVIHPSYENEYIVLFELAIKHDTIYSPRASLKFKWERTAYWTVAKDNDIQALNR